MAPPPASIISQPPQAPPALQSTVPWNPTVPPHPLLGAYLKTMMKHLRWVPKDRKQKLCLEIRGHLEEIAATIPGNEQSRYYLAIQRFGGPELVADQFVEAYGYGRKYLIAMSFIGFVLALLTIPIRIPFVPKLQVLCMGLPVLMTVIVFYLIIRVSIRAGNRTGFIVGTTSGVSRLMALGLLLALIASSPELDDKIAIPGGVIAGIFLVSVLMAISGYLPGRVLQKYQDD